MKTVEQMTEDSIKIKKMAIEILDLLGLPQETYIWLGREKDDTIPDGFKITINSKDIIDRK